MLPFLLLLTLAWGALAFGGVYAWGYVPLCVAAVSIGVSALRRRATAEWRPDLALVWTLVTIGLAMALTLVPLPRDLIVMLSPNTDQLLRKLEFGYAMRLGAGDGVRLWHTLSIVPSSTLLGLGLFVPLAVLLVGLQRGLRAREVRTIAPGIVGIGLLLALIALVFRTGANGRIYGVWMPVGGPVALVHGGGPFINKNHFAGWLLMAVPLGIGYFAALVARDLPHAGQGWRARLLWFSTREANQAVLVGASLLFMGLALAMSLSRSGIACFVIAIGITSWAIVRRMAGERSGRAGRPGRGRTTRLLLGGYLAFLLVLSLGWAGFETLAARFARVSGADAADRWSAWSDTVRIIKDFPLVGTGVGTFGDVMLFYQSTNPLDRVAQSHNDYLQVLAEGGLALAIPAVVFLAVFVRAVRRRFRDETTDPTIYWIRAGAVTGLIAIALQEIVEFSLQCPGNAVLCVVLMGIAAGRLPHRRTLTNGLHQHEHSLC